MSVSQTLDAHMGWLSDQPRIDAFRAALAATVKPGERVLDMGTGTGVLAILACEAGAAHVYAIDEGPIIGLAREIAHAHGVADRITFLRGHSSRITLPEPVDVAVADLIGHFAFEAGIFDAMTDARTRHLAPGGRTIPQSVTLHLAPVESHELRERVAFWRSRPAGIDTSPAHRLASHAAYQLVVHHTDVLGASHAINHFELSAPVDIAIGGDVSFVASRSGALDGVAGWFTACLSPGVFMSNAPDDPRRLDRRNLALPLPEPVPVQEGDAINVTLRVVSSEQVFTWTVDVSRDGQRIASHQGSTFRSLLLSREDLDHAGSAARPALNDEGAAQRLVLRMADGRHTVAEIEAAVRAGFTDVFPTAARAAEFVAEALARFAR